MNVASFFPLKTRQHQWLLNHIARLNKLDMRSIDSTFSATLILPRVHNKPCAIPHLDIDCLLVYTSSSLVLGGCWDPAALWRFFCSSMCSCDYISAWLDWRLGAYFRCHWFINKDGFESFSCYACIITNKLFSVCLFSSSSKSVQSKVDSILVSVSWSSDE